MDRAAHPVVTPVATEGAQQCAGAPKLKAGLYSDREKFAEHRWYRVDVRPGQELRASVSIAADRAVNNDYGVLLRASTVHGREIVRGSEAGDGRTDVISSGLRYPKAPVASADDDGRSRRRRPSASRSATPSRHPPRSRPTPACRSS